MKTRPPLTGGSIGAILGGATALLRDVTDSPRREAELLLAFTLKKPREHVLARLKEPVPTPETHAFASLVRRRAEGIPLPYLTKTREFIGRAFIVTPAVLIPRPETEEVVTETLRILETLPLRDVIVADVGTGSGVIGVSIAANAARTHVVATDNSPQALGAARRNARKHGTFRHMTFIESDLVQEVPEELTPHVIAANLPYVTSDALRRADEAPDTRGLTFEPSRALDGGPDGLYVIRRFLKQLRWFRAKQPAWAERLRAVVLEHSPGQRREIRELAYRALPDFTPRDASPYVTSWTKNV